MIELKYLAPLIKDAIKKADDNTRRRENDNRKLLPFIQDFNKNNPKIFHKVIKPISSSINVLNSFSNCKFLSANRQPRSILQILQRKNRMTISGVTSCNEARCKCCDIIISGNSIDFNTHGGIINFIIKKNLDCCSLNVIYKLIYAIDANERVHMRSLESTRRLSLIHI